MMSLAVVGLSCGLTAVMSIVFYRAIRIEMMITGFVCAVIIDRVVGRVTRHYRARLAEVNATLERRVLERTTELERANQALREAQEELLVRDRMATAGMLAAGISHEIRSPLGVIRIAVDELGEQLDARAPEYQYTTDISDAATRIETILKDLSSLARPVDDPLAPTEVAPVLDSAARLAAYRIGRGATLERLATDVPPVLGNASRLVQLALNLLVNAARATRSGAPNTIRIGASLRGDQVVIAVSDTGTGMTAETKARMFEPFFTTGGTTGGTGLGLAICRSIVERMGGTIAISSTYGEGTTVEVALPRA